MGEGVKYHITEEFGPSTRGGGNSLFLNFFCKKNVNFVKKNCYIGPIKAHFGVSLGISGQKHHCKPCWRIQYR